MAMQSRARTSPSRFLPVLALFVLCAGVLPIIVLLFPLLLDGAFGEADWETLAQIGGAYGGVSAVLSALALCGVAASLFFQWRQARDSNLIVMRERQFELIQLGITNPKLIYVRLPGVAEEDLPVAQYANLWMAYWKLLWDLGNMSEIELDRLSYDLFTGSRIAYTWWEKVGPNWNVSGATRARLFMSIVTTSHERASVLYLVSPSPQAPPDNRVPTPRTSSD